MISVPLIKTPSFLRLRHCESFTTFQNFKIEIGMKQSVVETQHILNEQIATSRKNEIRNDDTLLLRTLLNLSIELTTP